MDEGFDILLQETQSPIKASHLLFAGQGPGCDDVIDMSAGLAFLTPTRFDNPDALDDIAQRVNALNEEAAGSACSPSPKPLVRPHASTKTHGAAVLGAWFAAANAAGGRGGLDKRSADNRPWESASYANTIKTLRASRVYASLSARSPAAAADPESAQQFDNPMYSPL